MPHQGYFVIADITGYTAFLTGSELEHAQDILKNLFETLHENIKPPLLISNYQGDAILTYAPAANVLQGQTLLEMVETIYCEFARTLENMHHNTTCTCRACANIPNLDLKMFIHYGEYIVQDMRGKQELTGPDVIIAHRMMKNSVKEKTGLKAYALFTEKAIEAMGLSEFCSEMYPHSETYEHIGDVKMHAYCLRTMREREHQKRRVIVDKEKAWINVEVTLPVPPAVAWDYMNEPAHKPRWMGLDGFRVTQRQKGRVDVGTVNHCAHGKDEMAMYVRDWHPFEHVTTDTYVWFGGIMRDTLQLTPVEGGTRLALLTAPMRGKNPFYTALWKLVMMPAMKKSLVKMAEEQGAALRQIY